MKFVHAADLHIDSPLRGLDRYPGAPVDRLRGATRQAFIGLVDLAIREAVDFVILAGDIYDGDWADFRTGLFFREQTMRLRRAKILVFIVKGNHDAESQITRQLPEVDGVHVFSSVKAETVDLPDLGVSIHGRSFPNRAVPEDLVPQYPPPVQGRFNIGILHTSLTGREGHDPYAPTSVPALVDKGYDYFALGHVHAREVVRESSPRIIFPGNLQGRYAKETGPKGCEVVEVVGGKILSSDFVPLDVVRWHVMSIGVTGLLTLDELALAFSNASRQLTTDAVGLLHAVRVQLHGESTLHVREAEQPGTLAATVHAAAQDQEGVDIWVEQVELNLRSPFNRSEAVARSDAVGELVRLVDEIGGDDAGMREWFLNQLNDFARFPASLADLRAESLDLSCIRDYLQQAEATVIAGLSTTASGSRSR